MATNPPQLSRRPDIDGLRAVAIIPVVLFHASIPGFQGGFVGVDIFFVISGYLITRIIAKEVSAKGSFNFWNFYARRARRLLPAALLVIVASALVSFLLVSPLEQSKLAPSAVAALFYVSNIFYWRRTTDYFDPVAESDIYLHTWSLAVEEQFYLVWPALLLLAFKFRNGPVIAMGAVLILSYFLSAMLSYHSQPLAFFLSPFRAWEFAIGGLVGFLPDRRRRWASAVALLGLLLVAVPVVALSSDGIYPGFVAMIPVLGTAALLASGSSDHPVSQLLRSSPMRLIGLLSYSWYLWHWPVLIFGSELLGDPTLVERIGLALASLGLAGLTYVLVEKPIRISAYLAPRPLLTLGLAAAGTAASAGAIGALWFQAKSEMLSPPYRAFTLASRDRVSFPGCATDFADSKVRTCSFGEGEKTLALLGDSHAQMWFPAIQAAARGYRIVTFFKNACPAAAVPAFNRRLNRVETECAEWRDKAIRQIRALAPAAVIVTSAQGHADDPVRWRDGYRRTLTQLAPSRVILINVTPRFPSSVPECLARAVHSGTGDCSVSRIEAINPSVIAAEFAAAKGLPHVRVLDLTDELCGPVTCEPTRNGQVLYRDTNHVTESYARQLSPHVERQLETVVAAH
ncbi:MAG: acyltransferase [Pseudomonadota bacterium]|nr:acyltransferase [Sphingomonas sp.]MDQ3479562.1 acyltransferase [Pseudomonadota bacterium]